MIAVVLQPFTARGINYDRGHFFDTNEPDQIHPSLERQLLEQRFMRQAQPDEYEVWKVSRTHLGQTSRIVVAKHSQPIRKAPPVSTKVPIQGKPATSEPAKPEPAKPEPAPAAPTSEAPPRA